MGIPHVIWYMSVKIKVSKKKKHTQNPLAKYGRRGSIKALISETPCVSNRLFISINANVVYFRIFGQKSFFFFFE